MIEKTLAIIAEYESRDVLSPEYIELAKSYKQHPKLVNEIIRAGCFNFRVENVRNILESNQTIEGKIISLQDYWELL